MKESREKIERIKRRVEDLIELVLVKAMNYDHHPQFPKAEKLRDVSKLLARASHNLWLATACLMGEDDA